MRTFGDTDIVVLGAGCIGLTAARALLLRGFPVTVVSKHLPGDDDIFYASTWAGAGWSGRGVNTADNYILARSHRHLVRLARTEPKSGVCEVRERDYYEKKPDAETLWWKTLTPNFRTLEPGSYPSSFEYACELDGVVIDPPIHLQFLQQQIEQLGGKIIRREVTSLDELYTSYPNSSVFINASGLGSRDIVGIQDTKCFPDRGQNVLVSTSETGTMYNRVGNEYTYIIPRPLNNIQVCGGVHQPYNLSPEVDMDIVKDEILRANRLAPHLISKNPKIHSYVVGIRPAREGGYRLEHERVVDKNGRSRHILHSYGYGPSGWARSYGSADALVQMVEEVEFSVTAASVAKSKL